MSSAEGDAIRESVERARMALNSVPWWRPIKRQEAADRYKNALLRGALWEALPADDTRPFPPGTGDASAESDAACSDWPGACQHTPAHDNGPLTPEPRKPTRGC